jgi:hypothetical protein
MPAVPRDAEHDDIIVPRHIWLTETPAGIEPAGGIVVAEYFDIGQSPLAALGAPSRRRAAARRPRRPRPRL